MSARDEDYSQYSRDNKAAFLEGKAARMKGLPESANPYPEQPFLNNPHGQWIMGWRD